MSGREIESSGIAVPRLKPAEKQRRDCAAAVQVARRVVRETAGATDSDLVVRAKVFTLLDALGIQPDQVRMSRRQSLAAALVDAMRRRWIRLAAPHIARLEQQLAEEQRLNARLKGGQP